MRKGGGRADREPAAGPRRRSDHARWKPARGRETVGDLDLLVTGPDPTPSLDRFIAHPTVQEVLARGENKASARVGLEGLQVDVRALAPATSARRCSISPAARTTTSRIRTRRLRMGLKLSEYGLFRIEDDVKNRRRDRGTASMKRSGCHGSRRSCARTAASRGPPSKAACRSWWNCGDIVGDVHMHTTRPTVPPDRRNGCGGARTGASNTSPSPTTRRGSHGERPRRGAAVARRGVREDQQRGKKGIRSSPGSSATSCRDGALDLENDALAELDLVIGSARGHMNMEAAEMTDRLLRALDARTSASSAIPPAACCCSAILPVRLRPRGRGGSRRGVWMEINARPERLDLHGR